MRYGNGQVKGCRLRNPRDPAVQLALKKPCPECRAEPDQWCVGVSGTKMRGRRLSRLHFARCTFQPVGVS